MIRLFLALALLIATYGAGTAGTSPAEATARRMGRGVNILGYDGIWDGHADAPFRTKYFRLLREAGFQHVRINFHAFRHMDEANRMDPAVLARLDGVLEHTVAAGLTPVLDVHDFAACQRDPEGCAIRLKAFWTEIAKRYARRFPSAVYEILNEPGGAMTLARWTALQSECLRIIRRHDPNRTIVAALLNVEAPLAARVPALPAVDRNIIVAVHYYQPMRFTHQGAPWLPALAGIAGIDWGSRDDAARVTADFEAIASWARAEGRPVYLGEFGSYDRAPTQARARYAAHLARTAERLGWPWAYWQFDHDFAIFDTNTETWARPLLDALVPPGKPVQR
ncbi:glycoside hydrolase family 5 protein [Methylobacterium iners]|uniref:Endoglucanase H n=1 Tax=Methylobacterium iners TaxID=418707 RepID=A0ABQ4RU62_9HYPH|nr:cellulase family glycosylhydrolase [Methylobacterium iners]GJD93254.1 Endoglucanase H [Methylobacterium iners]